MPPSQLLGPDDAPSEDAVSFNRRHSDAKPLEPLPSMGRKVGGYEGMTDEESNPEIFPLVHEGSAKWSLGEPTSFGRWVAKRDGMVAELVEQDDPLLIVGAVGTGKQDLARLIVSNARNPRRGKPFQVVDCEAMQPVEIALDLFGSGEGDRNGKLITCDGGTVLVRHIERMPPDCRRKLVHFMKYQEIMQIDTDSKKEGVDVRLLATTEVDNNGDVPDLGDLVEQFAHTQRLPSLREESSAIPELLSEYLRPYDLCRDVYVNWLLDLMCHSWPGNFEELRRYCEKVKATASISSRSVLNGTTWPVAARNGYPPEFIHPSQVANSLLALSEWEFRQTKQWPKNADVSDVVANSLRLLVQISDAGKYDFRARGPKRRCWLKRPYYFHPYAIPLELFGGGLRTPACYDALVVFPDENYSCMPVQLFLGRLADLAVNPAKLTGGERFRVAFGTDTNLIGTLRPSESFLNWVGWLKASVPKYEEWEGKTPIPPVVGRAGRKASGPLTHSEPTIDECRHAKEKVERLLAKTGRANPLVGESDSMLKMYPAILDAAQHSRLHVMVFGETGTGKQAIYDLLKWLSPRNCPFVEHQLSGFEGNDLKSEVFGHVKGAYTDAEKDRQGAVGKARGGTLVLDNIQTSRPEFFSDLLRVLQPGQPYFKLGSDDELHADCRIVAGFNLLPEQMIGDGTMPPDWMERFEIRIDIPALNERETDIPRLVDSFTVDFHVENNLAERGVTVDTIKPTEAQVRSWMSMSWRGSAGNVRGLRNKVRAYLRRQLDGHSQDAEPTAGQTGRAGPRSPGPRAAMDPEDMRKLLVKALSEKLKWPELKDSLKPHYQDIQQLKRVVRDRAKMASGSHVGLPPQVLEYVKSLTKETPSKKGATTPRSS